MARLHHRFRVGDVIPNRNDVILVYHSVGGSAYDNIPTDLFRSHMELLKKNFEVVDLREIANDRSDEKRVAITFDDGTADFHRNVVPILEDYDFPVTVFLIGKVFEDDGFQQDAVYEYEYMTATNVHDMLENPLVTIGSHTYSHRRLPNLSEEEQRAEILCGKQILENRFGVSIDRFAYPYYSHDPSTVQTVTESHEIGVTGGNPGVELTEETNKATLPRLEAGLDRSELQWNMHHASTSAYWLGSRTLSLLP